MFNGLNDDCLFSIYSFLNHIELAKLSAVCREARRSVTTSSGANRLWRDHLDRVFPHWKVCSKELPSLEGDPGAPRSPKANDEDGYKRFLRAVKLYGEDIACDGSMSRLNEIVNSRLLPFLRTNAPHIAESLQPAVTANWFNDFTSQQECEFFRKEFLSLPGPLRSLYYILGGQDAGRRGQFGLFGSIFVYDLSPTCYFLHPQQAIILHKKCEPYHDDPTSTDIFPFSSSLDARRGLPLTFGVNKRSKVAQVFVYSLKSKPGKREPIVHTSPAVESGIGLIDWLDHYVQMLEKGVYSIQNVPEEYDIDLPISKYICLHPYPSQNVQLTEGSNMSTQVTLGLRITVGSTRISIPDVPGLFSYRCWIQNDGSTFPSVQLTHRTWVIKSGRGSTLEHVHGEGVIGLTPVITNCDEFIFNYASQTQVSFKRPLPGEEDSRPWMEGSFRFVPGTLESPTGPPFEAKVGRFHFIEPEGLEFIHT